MNDDPDCQPDLSFPQRLECRPTKAGWLAGLLSLYGIFCFLAGLFDAHSSPLERRVMVIAGVLMCLGTLLPLIRWQLYARIIADEEGLCWRTWGRWKRVAWSQITGYYLARGSRAADTQHAARIITTEDAELKLSTSFTHFKELTRLVEERALGVTEKAWHLRDSGVDEGICEFTYPEPRHDDLRRWIPSLAGALTFVLLLVLVNCSGLYFVLLPFGLLGLYPVAALLWEAHQNAEEVEYRLGQRITVDAKGIVFQRSDQTITAAWDDVTDYHMTRAGVVPRVLIRHVVVTKGGTFDFVLLPQHRRLKRIIARYATNAPHRCWQQLSTDSDCERHQTEADGTLVFSYRTFSVRALLWGVWGCGALALLMSVAISWCESLSTEPPSKNAPSVGIFLVPAFLCAAAYGFYLASSIRLDERGIARRTPLKNTFLAWEEVQHLEHDPGQNYYVRGEKTSILLSNFRPVDFEFLCHEVAQRSGLEWRDKSKNTEQNPASNV